MRVGNFSLLIPEGREKSTGHVEIPHNIPYKIKIANHCYDRACDAVVCVDGKEVGCFRLYASDAAILEHPVNDQGRFTFFKLDSKEAEQAGVAGVGRDDRGLITVVFKPEKKRDVVVMSCFDANTVYGARSKGGPGGQSVGGELRSYNHTERAIKTCGGITGLTGHSDQQYTTVANLDYDPGQEVTISVRLVCGEAVRTLVAVQRSNPVPVPVE